MTRPIETVDDLKNYIRALEAVREQYRASVRRHERLGRGCRAWRKSKPRTRVDHMLLEAVIDEWVAGEPQEAKPCK